MDTNVYMQIAEKILSQAVCPRCGAPLQDCGYDILEANSQKIVLELDCDECESVLVAHGAFQKKSRAYSPATSSRKQTVSPETVRGIGSALREFRGRDIQDLLQK